MNVLDLLIKLNGSDWNKKISSSYTNRMICWCLWTVKPLNKLNCPLIFWGDRRPLLQDGMTVQIEYYENEALNAQLPAKVICKVVETEPAVKGQTAANSFKPAVLDNGLRVMVPPFVEVDTDIVVHTETLEYAERA